VAGLVVLGVVVAILAFDLRRLAATGGHRTMAPPTAMAVNVLDTSGSALLLIASGLPVAIWAAVLMLPTCLQVLIGDRRMVGISVGAAAAWAAAGMAVDHADAGTTLAVAILFGGSWLLVLGILRVESMVSFKGVAMSEQFASLTQVAATASDEQVGVEEILELAGPLLRAGRLDLLRVGSGPVQQVATWQSALTEHAPLDLADVEAVAASGAARARPGRLVSPVPGRDGVRLVLAVSEAVVPAATMAVTFAHRVERVCLQIGTLVDRLDLVAQLEALIRTDSLTGLPNRRALNERLVDEVARARRTASPFTLVMIDLDRFKQYNDDFGHVAGDEALQAVASTLRERLRATDFLGRFGGEELVALLPDTTTEAAVQVLEELHTLVRHQAAPRPITFSAGVAAWDQLESPEQLLVRADAALYEAKETGRDRTCLHAGTGSIRELMSSRASEPLTAPEPRLVERSSS
jgi:diguanylate cyclase (GGDEF)-like protein